MIPPNINDPNLKSIGFGSQHEIISNKTTSKTASKSSGTSRGHRSASPTPPTGETTMTNDQFNKLMDTVNAIRTDVAVLKTDNDWMKKSLTNIEATTKASTDKIDASVQALSKTVDTVKDNVSRIYNVWFGLAGLIGLVCVCISAAGAVHTWALSAHTQNELGTAVQQQR